MFGAGWIRKNTKEKEQERRTYRLNHWSLVYVGEAVAAEGCLHGRPGYPEGVEIRTSVISSWDCEGEEILLHTGNSNYRCALSEYKWSNDSLELLRNLDSRSNVSVSSVKERIRRKSEEEAGRYRELIGQSGLDECSILCWHGCDLPYMKRVVTCCEGKVELDDLLYSRADILCSVMLAGDAELRVSSAGQPSQYFRRLGGDLGWPVLVENSGDREITAGFRGGRQVSVRPGEIVRVR